jgi:hypothetical protein
MNRWITIFKTGRHTDSSGVTRDFSTNDLDRMVQEYNPDNHEAPLVIGHPQTDSPAYGWVEALKRDGDMLLARFKQVPAEVKELVSHGRYKHRSVSLYPNGSLRHVGLLGATPPAIKGLGAVQFGDGETEFETYEFADTQGGNQGEAFMNELEQAQKEAAEAKARAKAAEEAKAKAEADKEAAETRAKAAEEAKAKTEAEFSEHRATEKAKQREAQFNELVEAQKLMPGDKDLVMGLAAALDSADALEFSENGQTVKQEPEAALWKILGSRAPGGLLGEFAEAPPDDDDDSDAATGDHAKTF